MPISLSWLEIDAGALADNLGRFKSLLGPATRLMAVVKGEAYGHGLMPAAQVALRAGADWLGVFNITEALELRRAGVAVPILVMGYVPLADLGLAVELDVSITVSSEETLRALAEAAHIEGRPARVHLKLETGTHRLGFDAEGLRRALEILRGSPWLKLEGAHTHFANIEDTTEHDYARGQLGRFRELLSLIAEAGFDVPLPHTACTAAAVLFPETYFGLARVGIGFYGMWPSKETYLSALQSGRTPLQLRPALTWKTRVAQVKTVPRGAYIGYGCSYRCTRETRLAILPVGYANGYDRRLSNTAHVLIRGQRAPLRGRVCMNLCMADVSDIPEVALEDEVVLLGRQGDECVTPEQMAAWAGTINYEIVTRADPYAERLVLNMPEE
jgi:alanine racemase